MKKQMLSLFLALALTGCAAPGPGSTSAPGEVLPGGERL